MEGQGRGIKENHKRRGGDGGLVESGGEVLGMKECMMEGWEMQVEGREDKNNIFKHEGAASIILHVAAARRKRRCHVMLGQRRA